MELPIQLHFGTDPVWLDELVAWAEGEPAVVSLSIFGSRASGVRRTKSELAAVPDLDIAFEVQGSTAAERFSNGFGLGREIKARFAAAYGVKLDLQFMDGDETPHVTAYVAATGFRVWVRTPAV